MRSVPLWMLNYIHNRVGRRAAMVEAQATYQAELRKSQRLVEIEDRYRQDKTVKMKSVNPERQTSQHSWIF